MEIRKSPCIPHSSATEKDWVHNEFVYSKVGIWKLRRISLISLLFLLVRVTTSGAEKATVKWPGTRNNNWNPISQTQGPDVSSPLHVAQCRATCLQKFNNRGDGVRPSSCFQLPDCFTCWKSCELLESTWKSRSDKTGDGTRSEPMCLHPRLCLSGCQVACRFYEGLGGSSRANAADPVVPTSRENVLQYSDGKIHWPRSPNQPDLGLSLDTIVFVVIQQYPDHKWRQITQTTLSEVEVPRGLTSEKSSKLRAVCVLVVSPQGLVTIYYPQLQPETVQDLSRKVSPSLQLTTDSTTEPSLGTTPPTNEQLLMDHEWNLRKLSLIHQKLLVIAELTWNHLPGAKDYLITWELDGGGLKGHLVTDSTTVTLSLWPDTVYHIQVELFGDAEEGSLHKKSFPVAVDTSEAAFPMERALALSKKESSHKSVTQFLNVTLLVAVSASLLVLIALALALVLWAKFGRRRSRDPQLLQHMEDAPDQPDCTGHRETKAPALALISPSTQSILPNHLKLHYSFHDPTTRPTWSLPFSSLQQPYFSPT